MVSFYLFIIIPPFIAIFIFPFTSIFTSPFQTISIFITASIFFIFIFRPPSKLFRPIISFTKASR
jgi:hypothetical protein